MKCDMEQIYNEHAKRVFKYLLSLSHDEDLAEELTQETFCRAVNSINRYNGSCKISVWLCQIAKHIWYQELEKKKKNKTEELDDNILFDDLSPEDAFLMQSNKILLHKAINTLSEPMKDVVYLRLSGELSFAEIGEVLGKNENWARTTFYRAKQKIMEVL